MLGAGTRTNWEHACCTRKRTSSTPQNTGKTQGKAAHTYNPRAGAVETESRGLAGLVERAFEPSARQRFCLKKQGGQLHPRFAPCTRTHTHTGLGVREIKSKENWLKKKKSCILGGRGRKPLSRPRSRSQASGQIHTQQKGEFPKDLGGGVLSRGGKSTRKASGLERCAAGAAVAEVAGKVQS